MHRLSYQIIVIALVCFRAYSVPAAEKQGESLEAVKQALNHYDHVIVSQDANAYDALLVDDYELIDYDGAILKKKDIVEAARAGVFKIEIGRSENVTVRIYGNTAITTGDWIYKGTLKGKAFHRHDRFTTVFVKDSKGWRVASDQVTVLKNL